MDAVADPLLLPLHETSDLLMLTETGKGSPMLMEDEDVQPLESVTKTVNIPPVNTLEVAEVPPKGDQLYEYGEVPPATKTVADPSLSPKHETPDEEVIILEIVEAWFTTIDIVAVHEFASVTVTVYVPADTFTAVGEFKAA